jgi:hypothetical protein
MQGCRLILWIEVVKVEISKGEIVCISQLARLLYLADDTALPLPVLEIVQCEN